MTSEQRAFGAPDDTSAGYLPILSLFAVVVAIGAFLVHEIYDLDVWWQVTVGKDILTTLSVPATDHFARAAMGRPYHDSHWLFQVILALTHKMRGMVGVELAMIALWGGALFFCLRSMRRWVSPTAGHILLFLVAMASVERFLPRPEVVTCLMIAVFYGRLQAGAYRTWGQLALFALLQAVWANCHGLFIIGPFMALCYLVGALARQERVREEVVAAGRLLAVVVAATLATPFGMTGWEYALLLFTEVGSGAPVYLRQVAELSPTFGAAARSGVAFWFFLLLLVAAVATAVPVALRRRLSLARLLLVIGIGGAALTARRNMPLFALVAAPFIAENLSVLVPGGVRHFRPLAVAAAAAMLASAWFPLSGGYYHFAHIPARFGLGVTPSNFPHRLPAFLDRINFQGQVLNSNTLGGFYLYHGYPKRLPLIDGRWEVYDPKVLETLINPERDFGLWQRLVASYDVRALLLHHPSREAQVLLPLLPTNPSWRLVYYDHSASFWMRTDTPGIPPAVDLSPQARLPFPPARVEDCLLLDQFLRFVGPPELRFANMEQALTFHWHTEELLEQIARTQLKLRRYAEAEGTLQRLQRENPRSTVAAEGLNFLAKLRRNNGVPPLSGHRTR